MSQTVYNAVFRPLFAYGAHVTLAASAWGDQSPDLGSVREDLALLVENALASRRVQDEKNFDNAWFAVCAWLDEKLAGILSADGGGHFELMQRRFFNTLNAGEEFFQRLAALLDGEEGEPDARAAREEIVKVYGSCLELGFKGRYFRPDDRPDLEAFRRRCLDAVLGNVSQKSEANRMFQPFVEGETKEAARPGMLFFWIAPVVITALLYLLYRILLADLYSFMGG